jgi:hypothetical protein
MLLTKTTRTVGNSQAELFISDITGEPSWVLQLSTFSSIFKKLNNDKRNAQCVIPRLVGPELPNLLKANKMMRVLLAKSRPEPIRQNP